MDLLDTLYLRWINQLQGYTTTCQWGQIDAVYPPLSTISYPNPCQQLLELPSGLPSKYYSEPMLLNFGAWLGTGVKNIPRPPAGMIKFYFLLATFVIGLQPTHQPNFCLIDAFFCLLMILGTLIFSATVLIGIIRSRMIFARAQTQSHKKRKKIILACQTCYSNIVSCPWVPDWKFSLENNLFNPADIC